jgi:Glyoxalase/Bleomycin resistance protein/Dioxygenase superfamily
VGARINHVSVNARDLQESVDFYVDLLGAEPIPTPNFGLPVQWLALGRTQLHLFERDLQPTSHHHLGITVDDLEPVYRAAERPGTSSSCICATPPATSSRSTTMASIGCRRTCEPSFAGSGSSTRRAKIRCGVACSCPTRPAGSQRAAVGGTLEQEQGERDRHGSRQQALER